MQEPSKNLLRTSLRNRRQSLSPDAIRLDSARIREGLLAQDRFRAAASAMLYLPARGEVDTWPLLEHFWARGAEVLLPRCCTGRPGFMDVYAVTNRDQLGAGCFGLTEPRPELAMLVSRPRPEVVLVPALAYDRKGHRLGFGGGYYDRFLPTLGNSPLLAGPAYAFQLLDALPAEPWDCPVHLVVTPDETLHIDTESRS